MSHVLLSFLFQNFARSRKKTCFTTPLYFLVWKQEHQQLIFVLLGKAYQLKGSSQHRAQEFQETKRHVFKESSSCTNEVRVCSSCTPLSFSFFYLKFFRYHSLWWIGILSAMSRTEKQSQSSQVQGAGLDQARGMHCPCVHGLQIVWFENWKYMTMHNRSFWKVTVSACKHSRRVVIVHCLLCFSTA